MVCPKCGSEIEDGWEGACDCANKKCIYTYKKGGTSYASIGEEWQARAEKAEGELKAIKARIEAVTEEKIIDVINHGLSLYMESTQFENDKQEIAKEIIKQIGGEK